MGRSAAIAVFGFSVRALVGLAFLALLTQEVWAQDEKKVSKPLQEALIVKLAPLTYPPLPRQTRITGDVELKVEVRPDGSVASVVVVKGHPLLASAAQDNAQKSQFACEHCGEQAHYFRLVYTFALDQSHEENGEKHLQASDPDHPNLRVMQSTGHVTVVDLPFIEYCAAGILTPHKVRSAKCLYLWRCGKPRVSSIE